MLWSPVTRHRGNIPVFCLLLIATEVHNIHSESGKLSWRFFSVFLSLSGFVGSFAGHSSLDQSCYEPPADVLYMIWCIMFRLYI